MNKALFLDRDGTLIEHRPYLHRPEEVTLVPGTKEALHRARAAGYLLFLFTNQSGIGRGYFTHSDVQAVHSRLADLVGLGPSLFTEICVAPEHPDQPSLYRKPSPRFILEMVEKHGLDPNSCWMIGDTASDWQAGRSAGIKTAAITSELTTAPMIALTQQFSIPLLANISELNLQLLKD